VVTFLNPQGYDPLGALVPPDPDTAPPPAAPQAIAPPRAAPVRAAPNPADDIYSQRVAELEAAKAAPPGAKPGPGAPTHAAQVQSDYARVKAQAQGSLAKTEADLGAWAPAVRKIAAFGQAAGGPLTSKIVGGVGALENVVSNAQARAAGQPTTDTGAAYRAWRDTMEKYYGGLQADYPLTSGMGMASGMAAGGEAAEGLGGLLKGLDLGGTPLESAKAAFSGTKTAKAARALKLAAQVRFNPAVVDWGENTAQATLSGAKTGALYSGAGGDTPQEHLSNALWGAGAGGLFGFGVGGVGLPVAEFADKARGDVVRTLADWAGKEKPEGLITPEDAEAAKQTIYRMAQRQGLRSGDVAAKAAPFTDPIGGQMLGVEGQNLTGSVARRAGKTGETTRGIQYTQAQGRPDELMASTARILGVDPKEARALKEGVVQQGQDEARPLYEAVGESPFGVNSSELDRLLNTKIGQTVLGQVHERAKLNQWSPEGLTWADTEVPPPEGAPAGAHPNEAPPVGNRIIQPGEAPPSLGPAPQVKVPRAPSEAPSQGMALHTWLARQGGVAGTDMGEAMARDLGKIGARSQQNAKVVEELAMRARDAGYFPAYQDIPTTSEFLDAVAQSRGGKPIYPVHGQGQAGATMSAADRYQAAQAAEAQNRALQSQHMNTQADSDEAFRAQQARDAAETAAWRQHMAEFEGPEDWGQMEPPGGAAPAEGYPGQPAPQYEPTPTTGLTPKSLVLLHQKSKPVYNRFGELGEGMEDRRDFHNALGQILLGHPETGEGALVPKYRDALAVSQQYKATQGAYDDAQGLLFGASDDDFSRFMNGMRDRTGALNPSALRGAQLRAAQDVYELAYKAALKGQKFTPVGVEDKLSQLFTPQKARALVAKMRAAAEQAAAENRMAPFSNSASAAMLNAAEETDNSVGGHVVESAHTLQKHGVMGLAGKWFKDAGAYRRTAGSSMSYRNALGQILTMKPAEFAAFLRDMETRGAPAPKPSLAKPVGRLTGAATSTFVAPLVRQGSPAP
jgi:hypothetical protein